jgi:hypothetical protein
LIIHTIHFLPSLPSEYSSEYVLTQLGHSDIFFIRQI